MWLLVALSSLYWLITAITAWHSRRRVPTLQTLTAPDPGAWPTVTVVIPARDEATHIHDALLAKLNDGYPALKVLVVDDRSTDDTGARAKALGDARVDVTRIDALPPDWLGKVHALQRGVEASDSDWLLFSDADVHLAPGTLRRVIAWATTNQVEFVSALPSITPGDAPTTVALQAFFRLIVLAGRLSSVADPKSTAAAGVGAFNLVKRSALQRTEGLAWLKMEVGDDMALGALMKRAGVKCAVLVAQEAVTLEFYPSLAALFRALEKNGAQAPAAQMVGGLLALTALELGFYAGLWSGLAWVQLLSLATFALAVHTDWSVARWLRMPSWTALMPGLGALPLNVAMLRSCLLAAARGGVVWRGTFYATAVVRAGQRLR